MEACGGQTWQLSDRLPVPGAGQPGSSPGSAESGSNAQVQPSPGFGVRRSGPGKAGAGHRARDCPARAPWKTRNSSGVPLPRPCEPPAVGPSPCGPWGRTRPSCVAAFAPKPAGSFRSGMQTSSAPSRPGYTRSLGQTAFHFPKVPARSQSKAFPQMSSATFTRPAAPASADAAARPVPIRHGLRDAKRHVCCPPPPRLQPDGQGSPTALPGSERPVPSTAAPPPSIPRRPPGTS